MISAKFVVQPQTCKRGNAEPSKSANETALVIGAINCTSLMQLNATPEVEQLQEAAISDATRRAYKSDMAHFLDWGGTLPSTPENVAQYIAEMARSFSTATIIRRVASISKAHNTLDISNPAKSELVKQVLRGLRRKNGTAQRRAKPLLKEDLFCILGSLGNRPKDIRDAALLLIGFAGGFRRSELVGLNVEDVQRVRQGMVVTLRRSKTDQEGQGREVGIPFGRSIWCPVKALDEWLQWSGIYKGAIFKTLNRQATLIDQRLSGEAVSIVLKCRLKKVGINPEDYSAHSLRSGFATSAAMAGASTIKIRQQTGHTSDAMLSRYIRDGDLFRDNAAGAVL